MSNLLTPITPDMRAPSVTKRASNGRHGSVKEGKVSFGVNLSETAEALRVKLAERLGINKTAVIELALRELAAKWGVE